MVGKMSTEMSNLDVAVIGLAGRFPGARNLDEYWQNLREGVESISFFSDEELVSSGVDPATLSEPAYVKAGGILEDIELFDASFFGFTPMEAETMDPQHRLFLECTWQALENAGYNPETYSGLIGVYAGTSLNSYALSFLHSGQGRSPTFSGDKDYMATVTSYKLNLKGPSITVQTFCSTALVALHLARQSLLNEECDLALAGGVSIRVPQKAGYLYQEGDILSSDGHVRAFDAQANGTVFSNGIGVVVLKRLVDAAADGDCIYAVIKGSAINNDGSLKVSYTAPSVDGQAEVIVEALADAGVDPETIGYIETHGTGTTLGDPIEITALTKAFQASTDKKGFCAIGAVKANIGHTDAAAGVAGLIKTVLALKHKVIPPSVNFKRPNPKIDFPASPFYVNTALSEWKATDSPRRAGVSAFGFGGTNAHVILEEAPVVGVSGPSRPWQLLTLSARTNSALETATDQLAEHFKQHLDQNLADAAYTLSVGRRAFNYRRILVCRDHEDAVATLKTQDPKRVFTACQEHRERPVAFMFSGQGAQYVNMGRDLYHSELLFREQVDTCADLLKPRLGLDLRHVLYPEAGDIQAAEAQLTETRLTQPALFVIEYALAQLWIAWGLHPAAMIGHSIGEYVAACLAGVFDLEDALALVAERGRLMQSMPPGAMLSVLLTEADVQPLLNDALTLATINAPERCVVSGPAEAIATLEQRLTEQGVAVQQLHTSHAFHSPMMEPILQPFEEQVHQVHLHEPQIPYISNVTGDWITPEQATDPTYWAQHLRQTVRFSDGVSTLAQTPEWVLLEVGPGHTLRTLAQRHPRRTPEQIVLSSMRHPQDIEDDQAFLLRSLGQLWLAGVAVDWQGFYRQEHRLRVPLPTYSFERQRYWIEAQQHVFDESVLPSRNPDLADWFYIPSWKRTLLPICEPRSRNRWLVFSNDDSLSTGLVQQVQARGAEAIVVLAGPQFAANGCTFTIRPAHSNDYRLLFKTLAEQDQKPSQIVHLWNTAPLDESIPDFTTRALERSFYSLLFLSQAIGAQDLGSDLQLVIISSNMQRVAGEETIHPEKATLLGPCKVIRKEMSIAARSVDIVLPKTESQEAKLIRQLIAEVEANTADSVIAYRGYDRWVQTYEPVTLIESQGGEDSKQREGGVYLITGGLGGIGLTLAHNLARTARARLVLTSRSRFPEPGAWTSWIATHDPRDRTSLRIQAVRELESSGAEVLVVHADVANQEQMEAAVHAARERFGTIHGVIHAAGLPGGGVIQLKTEAAAADVLRPKIYGTRVLEAALQDIPLDFMVLCSSLAAVTGDVGQVDYCAANAFLDAFAHGISNGQNDRMTVAVNWDAWAEVGMAVNTLPDYTATRSQQTPQMAPVEHPLFSGVYRDIDNRTIYQAELSPAEHWVLSEHVLMGIPTVPGTTYLELARAAFADRTQSAQFEIREALFLEPLKASVGSSKELQFIFEERAQGFDFLAMSKAGVDARGETLWQTHVTGHLEHLANATPPRYDVEAIRARCNVSEAVVTAEDVKRHATFIEFGPRWFNTLMRGNVGHNETLALIELSEEFVSDLEGFKLHPALLDIATSAGKGLLSSERLYLPLSYKQMRVYGDLPARFYSYVRLKPDSKTDGEIATFQVTLMDEQGCCSADIGEFTMKRVGEAAASRLSGSAAMGTLRSSVPQSSIDKPSQGDLSKAISPEEGAEAFRRILSRNYLPQIVVSPRHLPALIRQADALTQESVLEQVAQVETRLAKHPRPNLNIPYTAPQSEVETKIAAVWQALLGIEEVGVYDNFFELGGHSLLLVQMHAKIQKTFDHNIPIAQLFEYPTIHDLAQYLSQTQGEEPILMSIEDRGQQARAALKRQRQKTSRE
jgi:acyl transferase domain-containing protein/acyl carrier protein